MRCSGVWSGRVQGAVGGGSKTNLHFRCSTAVLSPRVGARKRAEGSHPQWIFRTRCLSVSTVEVISFSRLGNSFSFTISSSRTNLNDVRPAKASVLPFWERFRRRLRLIVTPRSRLRPRAQDAGSRPPFLFVRRKAAPSSAANASSREEPRHPPNLLPIAPLRKSSRGSVRYHRACPHSLWKISDAAPPRPMAPL